MNLYSSPRRCRDDLRWQVSTGIDLFAAISSAAFANSAGYLRYRCYIRRGASAASHHLPPVQTRWPFLPTIMAVPVSRCRWATCPFGRDIGVSAGIAARHICRFTSACGSWCAEYPPPAADARDVQQYRGRPDAPTALALPARNFRILSFEFSARDGNMFAGHQSSTRYRPFEGKRVLIKEAACLTLCSHLPLGMYIPSVFHCPDSKRKYYPTIPL